LYANEQADFRVTFPNSYTIGDFDPEIVCRFKYVGAGPLNFEAGGFIRKRVWRGPSREALFSYPCGTMLDALKRIPSRELLDQQLIGVMRRLLTGDRSCEPSLRV
jgi:hypothetical protein